MALGLGINFYLISQRLDLERCKWKKETGPIPSFWSNIDLGMENLMHIDYSLIEGH